ncbi:MAG TPA: CaiB/BaiF CoA-transferase family protein [Candidatus Limnocylindrales bacterium]|nr:CaiB/BaiF CoA-transferase family protein [Candidatus Limnocylindrales bacterium]
MALDRPLDGIRVLDLSRLLPGPWCSLLLADMGAEVIKVETPLAGDYARIAPAELGFGGVFEAVNRGKRSIAVNYRLPRGRELVLRLAAEADVFLASSMPGQLERRGLGPDDLRSANPRIVYCALSGYGQDGPYRDRPGHDLDYLALSGVLSILGQAGARPVPPGLQLADLAGGTLAALEIVSALFRRERTGQGAVLDVAVLDAVVGWLGPLGASLETAGSVTLPLAGAYPCYGTYAAADGRWLAVGALEPQFWVAFCRAVDRDDLVPRQFDPTAIPELAAIFASRPAEAWLDSLGDDACVVPVNAPAETERDPHVRARGLVVGDGPAMHVVTPLRAASGDGDGVRAPGLGDDTFAVLAGAGIPDDEVAALEAAGVIGGPATPEATARAARLGTALAQLAQRSRSRTADPAS